MALGYRIVDPAGRVRFLQSENHDEVLQQVGSV